MGCVVVFSIIIAALMTLIPTMPPPPVPTAPTPKVKRPRRPHWIAEIRAGKFKAPRIVKVEAESEGEAIMKLMTHPHNFDPRDVGSLRKGR
jgi:hypothetical protein